jgi:Holliday junction DNA helicase RuvA
MIGQLRGKLAEKHPAHVILDVHGVGYQVHIPLSTYGALGTLHDEVLLLIHTHLREDQISLYGFLTIREKQCFEMLLAVSGVGPSLALKILSGMSLDELAPAIRKGDIVQLTRIPGVGKKTAERIVVELRDRMAGLEPAAGSKPALRTHVESDVGSALLNLGYERRAVEKAIEETRDTRDASSFDELLRAVLRQLAGASQKRPPAVRAIEAE